MPPRRPKRRTPVWVHRDCINERTERILEQVLLIHEQQETMMANLTLIQAQVTRTLDLTAQAIALIQAGGSDQASIDALTTQLQTNADALQAALPPVP